jgi:hypothetical protein
MKKITVSLLATLLVLTSQAQRFKKTTSNAPRIPASAYPVLRSPDLTVRCSGISAITESIAVGGFGKREYYTYINVTITITNSGQMGSQPITLQGFAAPNPLDRTSMAAPPARYYDSKISIGDWRTCRSVEVGAIAGGATFSREFTYQFELPTALTGRGRTFFFCVLADYNKTTNETNENNNLSLPVAVTNPNY